MPVVLDGIQSNMLLWGPGRGDGGSPCHSPPGAGPAGWERVCSRSLTFLLAQDSNSKILSRALGSDPWVSTVPVGQAEIVYKLSFLF